MRFGDSPEPRVYSWGNPGVPRTAYISNSTLAAGRPTEGGKFSRNYVPMHDASTTDPVVRQVRWPQSEHDKYMYKSLTVLTDRNGAGYAENVVAVDRLGRMWTWGRDYPTSSGTDDPTGLGGPRLPASGMQPQFLMTRPIRVLRPDERDTGVTNTWTKVQCRAFQPCTVALDSDGKLFAAGIIPPWYFLDEHRTSNVSVTCFTQISTQTWNDFSTLGASLLGVRNDGTLHERGLGLSQYNASSGTALSTQVRGIVADAYYQAQYFMPTGTSSFITYTLNAPATGGRQATIGTATNTTTGEVRPFLSNHGAQYTSVSISSTSRSPATAASPPTLTLRLAVDTAWNAIYSNGGDSAILFTKSAGTTEAKAYLLSDSGNVPDDGFFSTNGSRPFGLTNLRFPMGLASDGNTHQSFVGSFEPSSPFAALSPMNGLGNTARNFAVRTNRSGNANSLANNFLVWGTNGSGCLAVGHTNSQKTITLSRCYQTAAANQAITLEQMTLADNHAAAIGRNPVRPTNGYGKLYCAGKFEFSGNSAATSNITTFTPVTPASANTTGRYWYSCYASGTPDEQLTICSRDYVSEDGRDNVLA